MNARERQEMASHLLEFEKFTIDGNKPIPEATDEELNSRYAKGEIRIITEQARYPLAGILGMLKEEIEGDGCQEPRYKLDPEYQRRHRWSVERKSRLIESFLMNVPVPPVFLYERDLARFEVMDGRQRLTTLSEFYANQLVLTGLQYWPQLNGKTYKNLPNKIRDGIDRRYISSIILLKETAADEEQALILKKIVFERLNSGGVKLSNQETRNAVCNGPLNKLCLELSSNKNFRRMWGIPLDPMPEEKNSNEDDDDEYDEDGQTPEKHTKVGISMFEKMEDVELVLRFFAYRKIEDFKPGLNKISEFLDRFIVEGNKFTVENLEQYKSMFEKTIDFLWTTLDRDAFTTLDPPNRRPTKIVYDPLMFVASSDFVQTHLRNLIENKVALSVGLKGMYETNRSLFSGRSTNFKDSQERNRLVTETFNSVIDKIKT
jgi:hypothetical protein